MFTEKQNYLIYLVLILQILSSVTYSQTSSPLIITSPSKFKLIKTNITFGGKKIINLKDVINPNPKTQNSCRIGDSIYYGRLEQRYNPSHKGLIESNLKTNKAFSYSMLNLANEAGLRKADPERGDIAEDLYGFSCAGNNLWMGTNGIGFIVFNAKKRKWSRYDRKETIVAGDHAAVNYASKDFVFLTTGEFPGAALVIYSTKAKTFLKLDYVSNKLFSEFGHNQEGEMVQIFVDHRRLASQPFLQIDWTFMLPEVSSIDNGATYRFVIHFSHSKTVFTVTKKVLEEAFKNTPKAQ